MYDKKCVARIREKKRHKTRISFSWDPWVISDFKEACEFNEDDWNELTEKWAKQYLEKKGIKTAPKRLIEEIADRQKRIDQVEAMMKVSGGALMKALRRYLVEELDRIRQVRAQARSIAISSGGTNYSVRDWRIQELEMIIKEAIKKYKAPLSEVSKIVKELSASYDESEKEKITEALGNVYDELELKETTGLSERDKVVLESTRMQT